MLHREIIAVCSEIHTKHINTLCGQNVELLNVKPGGTYSNHSFKQLMHAVVNSQFVTFINIYFSHF
jgi:hypothetical protein